MAVLPLTARTLLAQSELKVSSNAQPRSAPLMGQSKPEGGDGLREAFTDRTVKLTDLLDMEDELSAKLLEYFEKNFDVDLEKLRSRHRAGSM